MDSQVQGSTFRVRKRKKLNTRSLHKKCWLSHIIAKYHVSDPPAAPFMYRTGTSKEVGNGGQVCGDL